VTVGYTPLMRRILNFRVALALLLALTSAACAGTRTPQDDGRLAVVATTTQLTDFARVIGGDRVRVTGILKANVDAHDYEPSPADIDAIARAAVLLENGVGLEAWLDDTIEASGFDGRLVDTSRAVTLLAGEGDEAGASDPHIWQSPANAKVMVANIERALAAADPGGASAYRANLDAYRAELDRLDVHISQQLGTLDDRRLVTNHDAFGYYARRYHLEVVGAIIPSFDTSAELSAKEVNDLVARIRATGTRAVFSEASLPPQTAETVAREAGVRVVAGEDALYGDSLGPDGSDGATYLDMLRHNTRVIADNLR
jgi:manganese/iron transport system substrate-binding protein